MSNQTNNMEFFPDECTRQLLADLNAKMQEAMQLAAQPWAQQMQGVIQHEIRRAKLPGSWRLEQERGKAGADGIKFVRTDEIPQQAEFTKKSTRKR